MDSEELRVKRMTAESEMKFIVGKTNWTIEWLPPDSDYGECYWYVHCLLYIDEEDGDKFFEGEGIESTVEGALAQCFNSIVKNAIDKNKEQNSHVRKSKQTQEINRAYEKGFYVGYQEGMADRKRYPEQPDE